MVQKLIRCLNDREQLKINRESGISMRSSTAFIHYVWLFFLVSSTVLAQPSKELIEQAEDNQLEAQIAVAQQYQSENKFKQAHYWYLKAALQGDSKALQSLGQLYEQQKQPINPLNVSENWYQLAIDAGNSDAEDGYSRVLEALFNQQRAKQVSSIALLDQHIDQDITTDSNKSSTTVKPEKSRLVEPEIIIISSILLVVVFAVALRRKMRSHKQSNLSKLEKTIAQQSKKIRSLQLHLNKAHLQLKRNQQIEKTVSNDNKLVTACAVLGYVPNRIPDEKQIKLRYKMLSRIYHPDTHGSDEEMKRLNSAIKIVISHVKSSKA